MPQKIGWTLSISIASGPQASHTKSIEVEAYDSMKVEVPMNTADLEVQLQPGLPPTEGTLVKFLAISASRYEDLTYKVNEDTADPVTLDGPQVFAGGAVQLLAEDPETLFFSNASTTDDATVEVLVGRDVTPPSP